MIDTHRHFASTDSTNIQLIADVICGKLAPHLVHLYTADTQSAGRGQHGRTWVSGAGNVFLSLYVPIGKGNNHLHRLAGMLSLAVGFFLAKLDILERINQYRTQNQLPQIGVKWANDIGFYDDVLHIFKKLAGILIEPVFIKQPTSTLVGVVIGVGLNVQSTPTIKDGLYEATSLSGLWVDDLPCAAQLYLPMSQQILHAVTLCNQLDDKAVLQRFIEDFNQAHVLTGYWVQIFMQNDMQTVQAEGRCLGIDEQGGLLLQHNANTRAIYAGMAKIKDNT